MATERAFAPRVFRTGISVVVLGLCVLALLAADRPVLEQRGSTPSGVEPLFERYVAGDFDGVARDLTSVADWQEFAVQVERQLKSWPVAFGAAFALEATAAAQDVLLQEEWLGFIDQRSKEPRCRMLAAAQARIEQQAVSDAFALAWYLAAAALSQGMGAEFPSYICRPSLDNALRRFPGDQELRLAAALAAVRGAHDRYSGGWYSEGARAYLSPEATRVLAQAIRTLEPLVDDPRVGPEASLHTAFFKLVQRQRTDGIRILENMETRTTDPWILYIARLLSGRALANERRPAQARVAFERALELKPGARSALIWLAAVSLLDGHRPDALKRIDAVLAAGATDDPWPWFAYGEYRRWPERLTRLRRLLR